MKEKNIKSVKLSVIMLFLMTLTTVILFNGCKEEPSPSLYDPNYVSRPQPIIDSVVPKDAALAGVHIISIYGKNFSAVKGENFVFFNGLSIPILEENANLIKVKAPDYATDSLYIRIAVHKAELFSEKFKYKLNPAYALFYDFKSFEEPYAITMDKDGNMYVSLVVNNLGAGIKKITPAGKLENFSPYAAPITKYANLKIGPDGDMFACNADQRIIRINKTTGTSTNWVTTGLGRVADFDFDNEQNIWCAGNNTAVYRVRISDKNVKSFPITANFRAVRVYNGYVYFGGRRDTIEGIWRATYSNGELGTIEKYLFLNEVPNYTKNQVLTLTFDAVGNMYVGTDNSNAILYVSSNKSVIEPLYEGLFKPKCISMTYGIGTDLYYTRDKSVGQQLIYKVYLPHKSAPYYGRGD